MKYAIYDKAANGYLTKMEFEVGYSDNTQFECGLNEYITEAKLLDTPKEAADAIEGIESFKFMDKGRFVIHSFDDTLKDQYIISEAGNPTKVVDNITVDLEGTINVKYGTMAFHWSTAFLEYAINRMNALQKAKSPKYTAWCNTFDIYKVIPVIDERSCDHYQFIKVTEKGLAKYAKDEEVVSFNKRIEELEKANYELGEQVAERGAVANRLLDENNSLKTKVESIKKEARDWKKLYENADADREELKNVIDIIHTDLVSSTACNDLKDTLKAINHNSGLDHISMENFLTAKDEICSIISHVITILESRELNQSVAFSAAEDIKIVKEKNDKAKEIKTLRDTRGSLAEVIFAIRNAIRNNDSDAFCCINSRMIHDADFNSDPFMAGARENIKDICSAGKINISNNDMKNSEIARLTKERDKALERAEFYKRQANSVYGMTIPSRCCGKQVMADILSGKKVPIDKKKYDDLVEYVANINLTYDAMFCMMDKPIYLSTITEFLGDLTK